MQFLANPYKIWEKPSYMLKRMVLRLAFADPLEFDRFEGVRTPKTTLPFKALSHLKGSDFKMVPTTGFELSLLVHKYCEIAGHPWVTPQAGFVVVQLATHAKERINGKSPRAAKSAPRCGHCGPADVPTF